MNCSEWINYAVKDSETLESSLDFDLLHQSNAEDVAKVVSKSGMMDQGSHGDNRWVYLKGGLSKMVTQVHFVDFVTERTCSLLLTFVLIIYRRQLFFKTGVLAPT